MSNTTNHPKGVRIKTAPVLFGRVPAEKLERIVAHLEAMAGVRIKRAAVIDMLCDRYIKQEGVK